VYHFVLAYSAWELGEPILGGESFTALAVGLLVCPSGACVRA